MLTIGSVITYSELQSEIERVLSITDKKMRDISIACWRLFSDLDLSEAKKTEFTSLHDCFTRELKPGLRPFDPDPAVVASYLGTDERTIARSGAVADVDPAGTAS